MAFPSVSTKLSKRQFLPSHNIPPSEPFPSFVHQPASLPPTKPVSHPTKSPRGPLPSVAAQLQSDDDFGKLINDDVLLLSQIGWKKFIQSKVGRGDIGSLHYPHPANRLLHQYKAHGVPVRFSTPPWNETQLLRAIARGAHPSCKEHHEFLQTEFSDMIRKSQWVVLPYSVAKTLPGLRLSPPGVIDQRDRRPRWVGDYSFYDVNADTVPLAARESMQFGSALERFLREILLADPAFGPVYLAKTDCSDGFYRIHLAPDDIPKLGLLFPHPTLGGGNNPEEQLVALPLVLPMGWTLSPPVFCTATETVADVTNSAIQAGAPHVPHPLEDLAATLDQPIPLLSNSVGPNPSQEPPKAGGVQQTESPTTPLAETLAATPLVETLDPSLLETSPLASTSLGETLASSNNAEVESLPSRDPCLPSQSSPAAYVDVFVDDFIKLAQGEATRRRVRSLLFHALDSTFRPNDFHDSIHRREPNSIKKLRKGDCSWSQIKQILGWIVNTATMTISLPPHRVERLAEILASIPTTQKRCSVKKWHKVLGELRSMSLALPGSRHLFSQMQNALSTGTKTRIALKRGVHQALNDFRWLHANISERPTRIAELIPLTPQALGFHDASGSQGAGGVWFPTPELVPRLGLEPNIPLLWRLPWPQELIDKLVSDDNPSGSITSADFELAGGLLHLDTLAHCYDVRERTIVSKTDNLNTMFWERKGSCTTDSSPAYLLRLFGIHQRYHRYISRHDYQPGLSNKMADDASRLFHLSDSAFLEYFNTTYPQPQSYKLVSPRPETISSVISALHKKTCNVESLLVEPPPPLPTGQSGSSSVIKWASTPYSKPSATKYPSFKSSSTAFDMASVRPIGIRSSLEQLKSTYGQLRRRTSPWGPRILG